MLRRSYQVSTVGAVGLLHELTVDQPGGVQLLIRASEGGGQVEDLQLQLNYLVRESLIGKVRDTS
jgi:hypothetical protein